MILVMILSILVGITVGAAAATTVIAIRLDRIPVARASRNQRRRSIPVVTIVDLGVSHRQKMIQALRKDLPS